MRPFVSKAVKRGNAVKFENRLPVIISRESKHTGRKERSGLDHTQGVRTRVSVGVGQVRRMQALVECLPQQMLIELYGIVPNEESGRPGEKLFSDAARHFIVGVKRGVEEPRRLHLRHAHGARRGNDMRQKPAANFEALQFVKLKVRVDGGELKNLVKRGVGARRLGIVENEPHDRLQATLSGHG